MKYVSCHHIPDKIYYGGDVLRAKSTIYEEDFLQK